MHTRTHKCVHKTSSTNFSGGHHSQIYRSNQVTPMLAHRATKHVALQIANTCYSGCCIQWQLRNQTWPSSVKPCFCQPTVTTQPSYRLCVVIPFPIRLACLANLSQCLHVNLTSWQAHWSATKMTWLARGSVLLFGSHHPQVPLKWVTTAWFCKKHAQMKQHGVSTWLV